MFCKGTGSCGSSMAPPLITDSSEDRLRNDTDLRRAEALTARIGDYLSIQGCHKPNFRFATTLNGQVTCDFRFQDNRVS